LDALAVDADVSMPHPPTSGTGGGAVMTAAIADVLAGA
jgi:hypothetical protein